METNRVFAKIISKTLGKTAVLKKNKKRKSTLKAFPVLHSEKYTLWKVYQKMLLTLSSWLVRHANYCDILLLMTILQNVLRGYFYFFPKRKNIRLLHI